MPTAKRRPESSVIERLLATPQRFQFTQAVRMLSLWQQHSGVAGADGQAGLLRFQNSVSLRFPVAQIESVFIEADRVIDTTAALQNALREGQLKRIVITPTFMGLLGLHGVLPHHYTDAIAARLHYKNDGSPRAFFDIFSNRALHQFYQAWSKYRVEYRQDANGVDNFLPLQLALAGVQPHRQAAIPPEDEIGLEVAAFYAAVLRQRPVTASIIADVLSEYFGLPIAVKQCIGRWSVLAAEERSTLGVGNVTLGRGVTLGMRCWERDARVRIRIGPLAKSDYDRFLPRTSGAKALRSMLSLFALPALKYEVQLVLRAQDVQATRLLPNATRLGMGLFLVTRPSMVDRDDLIYELTL